MDEERHGFELGPEQLRKVTDSASLGFETTEALPPPREMVGQSRAQEAIDFALEMTDSRYNLYVAGPSGTGRRLAVTQAVERVARTRHAAQDWCYVANFDQADEPRALALPTGQGKAFAQDVDAFVLSSRRALRQAFTTDDYAQKRRAIIRELQARRDQILDVVRTQALALGFAIRESDNGIGLTPVTRAAPRRGNSLAGRGNTLGGQPPAQQEPQDVDASDGGQASVDTGEEAGELVPMTRDQVAQLSPEQRQQLEENEAQVEDMIERMLFPQVRRAEDVARARLRALDRDVADRALATVGEDIIARYASAADAVEYLRRLRADMVAHARELRGGAPAGGNEQSEGEEEQGPTDRVTEEETAEGATQNAEAQSAGAQSAGAQSAEGDEASANLEEQIDDSREMRFFLRRYKVNVISTHGASEPAPIVEETNPTRGNLLGRIEVGVLGGMPYTDHLMIKPGAIHRANGGYLILHARDLIGSPQGWETLKRVLRFGTITMDINADGSDAPRSASLRPEPILANIRVVLIGARKLYGALAEVDSEFLQLFKVRADFDSEMERTPQNEVAYAHFAGDVARSAGSPPLTAKAISLLILEGSRWVDDQERLSTLFGDVRDLTSEACYWARKSSSPATTGAHMRQAIQQRLRRISLAAERVLYEQRENGQIMIDTDGEVIGQINGLSVISTVDMEYGAPTRITARTAPGFAGVTNIEREVDMSGPSHDKGVLVLAGFLSGRFARESPLGISASICFEQEYGGVDGDSASSAELYALLSSLAAVPIRQSLAVTGSVNQLGEVQAIGGVNEKIEGFFRLCTFRGLNGRHGVLIPRANIRNVVLRDEVVEAVRAGLFHVYAVSTIDEGIELLTGVPAGRPGPDGTYLAGTINSRIVQAIQAYNERVRAFGLVPAYAAHPVR
jgi:predicted ATP-dependent protease